MAKKINIDKNLEKIFSKKTINNKKRELKVYFLIVCEGKATEPNYFKSFPDNIGKYIYDISCEGTGANTSTVVDKAISLRDNSSQKYDRIWVVFDRDNFPPSRFNSAIIKAKNNNINCAWSNEAFELWYILHFQYRNTAMSREGYKKYLEKIINEKIDKNDSKFKYEKNEKKMFDILKKYGNQKNAIINAKKLNLLYGNTENFAKQNPNTLVHKLVEELNGDSKELNDEITEKYNDGK